MERSNPNKLITPKQIGIFRALQLGDLMCAVPAVRALRRAYPEAEIILIGLTWAKDFVSRFNHYFNDFLAFPGYPGLLEQEVKTGQVLEFLYEVQKRKFDLVLQLHGSGELSNTLISLFGAKQVAGYFVPNGFCPSPETFKLYENDRHEIVRFVELVEFLGIKGAGYHLEFPIFSRERESFGKLKKKFSLSPGRFVCLNPGARDPRRRWKAQNFAAVGEAFAKQGYEVVLTGSLEDRPLNESVAKFMIHPSINLAGLTSLGELGALLENSLMLITNDTGISHVAAALNVKSAVIFSGFSDPLRWAPLDKDLHISVNPKKAEEPGEVIKAAFALLERQEARTGAFKEASFPTSVGLSGPKSAIRPKSELKSGRSGSVRNH